MPRLRLTTSGVVAVETPRHRYHDRAWRSTSEWQRFRARIIERDRVCQVCGEGPRIGDPLTAGHIIAVSRGGARFDDRNARAEHRSCNSARGTR